MHDGTAGAVTGVNHHFDAPREMELRADLVDVGLRHIHTSLAPRAGEKVAPLDQPADLLNLFAMNSRGPAHDFEAVVFGWIVAAGDHDAGVRWQVKDGIIKQRRGHDANIGNLAAAGLQAAHKRIAQTFGAEAEIAPQVNPIPAMAPQISA